MTKHYLNNSVVVSIIMSAKNVEKYLPFCINSITNQTYSNWELLIFNDGSTDKTLETLQLYKDKRMIVYTEAASKGIAERSNFLSSKAKGDFIAIMDADDIMHPERLERQVDFLKKNKKIDVVGSYAMLIDESGKELGIRRGNPVVKNVFELSIKNRFLIHPSLMVRKAFYEENKYDPDFSRSQDYELWLRTFDKYSFAVIKQPLIYYRVYKSSFKKAAKSHFFSIKALQKNKQKFKSYEYLLVVNYTRLKFIVYSFFTAISK